MDTRSALKALQVHSAVAPYAVWYVLRIVRALRNLLAEVNRDALDLNLKLDRTNAVVPYMYEVLDFAMRDRASVLKKRRWP